jgi:tetratricopeptide (TPR) repeat protein
VVGLTIDNWEHARAIVRSWLDAHAASDRSLASMAEIQPSVVTRFFQGGLLGVENSLRIYRIIFRDLGLTDQEFFLTATGLSSYAEMFAQDNALDGEVVSAVANWGTARALLREWATTQHKSLQSIARDIGTSASVLSRFQHGKTELSLQTCLRLYAMFYNANMERITRREFLIASGLLPLVKHFRRHSTIESTPKPHLSAGESQALVRELLAQANQPGISWNDALEIVDLAENFATGANDLGAQVAIRKLTLLTVKGDYPQAALQGQRIAGLYQGAMQPETYASFLNARGYLGLYHGDLAQAAQWLEEGISVTQTQSWTPVVSGASHFLGRIYVALGKQSRPLSYQYKYFEKATQNLDVAYQYELHDGAPDVNLGFQLLRRSELLLAMGDWQEARLLRRRTRHLFGQDPAVAHLEIAEGRLSINLDRLNVEKARLHFERGLEGWASFHFPKGLSEALHGLSMCARLEGNNRDALEYSVAAYLVHSHSRVRSSLYHEIASLREDMVRTAGLAEYNKVRNHIIERIVTKQPPYHILSGNYSIEELNKLL